MPIARSTGRKLNKERRERTRTYGRRCEGYDNKPELWRLRAVWWVCGVACGLVIETAILIIVFGGFT